MNPGSKRIRIFLFNKDYKMKQEIEDKINACIGNTAYGEFQIQTMKDNANVLFDAISGLNEMEVELNDEVDKDGNKIIVKIEIENYKFSHNMFLVYFKDWNAKKGMQQIFNDWKEKGSKIKIGGTGYGDAFVISYDCWEKIEIN